MREPIIKQSPTEIVINFDKKWLAYNHVLLTNIGMQGLGSTLNIEAHPVGSMNLPPQMVQYNPSMPNTTNTANFSMDGIVKGKVDENNEKRKQSHKHHDIWEKIKLDIDL